MFRVVGNMHTGLSVVIYRLSRFNKYFLCQRLGSYDSNGFGVPMLLSEKLIILNLSSQDETHRLTLEHDAMREKIKENQEKIKLNKQLPYLVGNVVEVLSYLWFSLSSRHKGC